MRLLLVSLPLRYTCSSLELSPHMQRLPDPFLSDLLLWTHWNRLQGSCCQKLTLRVGFLSRREPLESTASLWEASFPTPYPLTPRSLFESRQAFGSSGRNSILHMLPGNCLEDWNLKSGCIFGFHSHHVFLPRVDLWKLNFVGFLGY